jgi:hypothetical protein
VVKLVAFNLIQSFLYFNRRGPSKHTLTALRRVKGSKAGLNALVLGNGPSLAKINLSNIREKNPDIFVVNAFNQMSISAEITPKYYCLSDPDSIIKPDRPVPHNHDSTFEFISKNNCTLLLSHFYRKIQIPESIKCIYFNDKEFTLFSRNLNPCFPRGYSSLTILKAISVALYMGYDKIYILGVDNTEFNSLVGDLENRILLNTDNLYADNSLNRNVYFHSSAGGAAGAFLQYANWFGDFGKFPKNRIINLDTESLIDAFPKSKVMK